MKRDLELVRAILLWIESRDGTPDAAIPTIDGYSEIQVGHHVYLLVQAGLVEGIDLGTLGGSLPVSAPNCLTWSGHEFLDASRDEFLWGDAKKRLLTAGGVSFAVLLEWLKVQLRVKLGLPAA
jgi:hypothetical protein